MAERIGIIINLTDGMSKGLAKIRGNINRLDRDVRRKLDRSLGVIGRHVTAIGAAIGAIQLSQLGRDAEETANRFNQVFGDMAATAETQVNQIANAVGRGRTELRQGFATFQSFFLGLDFGAGASLELSSSMQQLALDFASFNNLSDEEALSRFISAMSGSSEVVDKFGINLKAAALDQELLRMGIEGGTAAATEQQKVIARYAIIMRSMTQQGAVGDAVRTQDSFANQLKRTQSIAADLGAEVGLLLNQALIPFLRWLNGVLPRIQAWVQANPQLVEQLIQAGLVIASTVAGLKALTIASALLRLTWISLAKVALNPWTLWIGGITAALAALAKLDRANGTFGGNLVELENDVLRVWDAFESGQLTSTDAMDNVVVAFQQAFIRIKHFFWEPMRLRVIALRDFSSAAWSTMADTAMLAFETVALGVKTVINNLIQKIGAAINSLVQSVGGVAAELGLPTGGLEKGFSIPLIDTNAEKVRVAQLEASLLASLQRVKAAAKDIQTSGSLDVMLAKIREEEELLQGKLQGRVANRSRARTADHEFRRRQSIDTELNVDLPEIADPGKMANFTAEADRLAEVMEKIRQGTQLSRTEMDLFRDSLSPTQTALLGFVGQTQQPLAGFFESIILNTKSLKEAFRDMVDQIVKALARMVAQMLAQRAVMAAMNLIAPGAGTIGAAGGGMAGFNSGGFVPGGGPDRDSVPAMLTPRELVIPRREADALRSGNFGPLAAFLGRLGASRASAHGIQSFNTGGTVRPAAASRGSDQQVLVVDDRTAEQMLDNPTVITRMARKHRQAFLSGLGLGGGVR